MNTNNDYPFRRGHCGDNNHWYSSTYWRSNRHKLNNCRQKSVEEEGIVLGNLNVVRSDEYSFRPNVRSYSELNSRVDSRQSIKRSNESIEPTENQKRLRIRDPFESPDSMIKDFRLTSSNSIESMNALFCQSCQTQCLSSLDYSNHLSGRGHKNNLEASDRPKQTDDRQNSKNQLHRLLRESKESAVGLDYMKETKAHCFTCNLCKCYDMTVYNALQHIKGGRHRRNFIEKKKESDDKRKRSVEREKRETHKRSVCSSTQTCDHFNGGDQTHSPRKVAPIATSSRSSQRERTINQIICGSDFEKFDSCKKTIENFRTIREICDQMIGYFSEKQNSTTNMSPKNRSLTTKTLESLNPSKIKKEN